ncbi:hypothetical protein HYH03_014537 [Edaphochlamys debaryana]|uniref:Guanylate cyclase domain-containing protein n=1 Tax=Edaphochlamys debaryana TaxID=47281 RepID=A0A835XNM2_9CHLO|nr:hypothetical protein HYH03_014537 [Edaphochlamys debaryana]|eukprot:KAG2486854.1 hypothetical protein HYH03_014537 [Edaphochlamys debaryana]
MHSVSHFVPGDFGGDRFFLSMRMSPFAYRYQGVGSAGETSAPGGADGGPHPHAVLPAMILELDAPHQRKASRQRGVGGAGHVLHQNRASVAYMGCLVGLGPNVGPNACTVEAPPSTQSKHGPAGAAPSAAAPRPLQGVAAGRAPPPGAPGAAALASQDLWPDLFGSASGRVPRRGVSSSLEAMPAVHGTDFLRVAPGLVAAGANPLHRLFAFEPDKLAEAMAFWRRGKEWKGILRVPERLSPDRGFLLLDTPETTGAALGGGAGGAVSAALATSTSLELHSGYLVPMGPAVGVVSASAAEWRTLAQAGGSNPGVLAGGSDPTATTYPVPGSGAGVGSRRWGRGHAAARQQRTDLLRQLRASVRGAGHGPGPGGSCTDSIAAVAYRSGPAAVVVQAAPPPPTAPAGQQQAPPAVVQPCAAAAVPLAQGGSGSGVPLLDRRRSLLGPHSEAASTEQPLLVVSAAAATVGDALGAAPAPARQAARDAPAQRDDGGRGGSEVVSEQGWRQRPPQGSGADILVLESLLATSNAASLDQSHGRINELSLEILPLLRAAGGNPTLRARALPSSSGLEVTPPASVRGSTDADSSPSAQGPAVATGPMGEPRRAATVLTHSGESVSGVTAAVARTDADVAQELSRRLRTISTDGSIFSSGTPPRAAPGACGADSTSRLLRALAPDTADAITGGTAGSAVRPERQPADSSRGSGGADEELSFGLAKIGGPMGLAGGAAGAQRVSDSGRRTRFAQSLRHDALRSSVGGVRPSAAARPPPEIRCSEPQSSAHDAIFPLEARGSAADTPPPVSSPSAMQPQQPFAGAHQRHSPPPPAALHPPQDEAGGHRQRLKALLRMLASTGGGGRGRHDSATGGGSRSTQAPQLKPSQCTQWSDLDLPSSAHPILGSSLQLGTGSNAPRGGAAASSLPNTLRNQRGAANRCHEDGWSLDKEGGTASRSRFHEVLLRPCTDPLSSEPLVLVVQTDVTSKVRAEAALVDALEAEHRLLSDIFPAHVLAHMTAARRAKAAEERQWGHAAGGLSLLRHVQDPAQLATHHESCTVLFADIKGFTQMSKEVPAVRVMTFLNALYTHFDSLTDLYGVYKVETIGDCYMVAGGLMASAASGRRPPKFARAMLVEAAKETLPSTGEPVQIRVGIHSGPATSGVVGTKMPRFCLFGDTINTASRMESTGSPGCIHVSAATRRLLPPEEDGEGWAATGGVEVKGKGRMESFTWRKRAAPRLRLQSDSQHRTAMLLGTLRDSNVSSLVATAAALEVYAAANASSPGAVR